MTTNEPKFIYSKHYYFSVDKNIIYGEEKYSRLYFHEISHYKDHQKENYKHWSNQFSIMGENLAFFFIPFILITWLFCRTELLGAIWLSFLALYSIYASFIFQEEIRAEFFGYVWGRKWEKLNKMSKLKGSQKRKFLLEMMKQ